MLTAEGLRIDERLERIEAPHEIAFRRSFAPPTLLHYTTLAGVCGIATSKCVWTTSIRHLSDATEFTYAHDVLRQALQNAVRGMPSGMSAAVEFVVSELDFSKIPNHLNITGSLATTYVTALSAEPDKLSQWRSYCPGGGYALGFRADALQVVAKHQGFELVACSYDRQQHVTEAQALAKALNLFRETLNG